MKRNELLSHGKHPHSWILTAIDDFDEESKKAEQEKRYIDQIKLQTNREVFKAIAKTIGVTGPKYM